jgi:uncharacterized protein YgiM (DUF1202 family)
MKKIFFISIILALSLLIGNSLPGYAAFTNETMISESNTVQALVPYEVISDNVSVKSQASASSTTVGTVNEGDIVYLISASNGWAYVFVTDGYFGYVQTGYLRLA